MTNYRILCNFSIYRYKDDTFCEYYFITNGIYFLFYFFCGREVVIQVVAPKGVVQLSKQKKNKLTRNKKDNYHELFATSAQYCGG